MLKFSDLILRPQNFYPENLEGFRRKFVRNSFGKSAFLLGAVVFL